MLSEELVLHCKQLLLYQTFILMVTLSSHNKYCSIIQCFQGYINMYLTMVLIIDGKQLLLGYP